MCHSLLGSTNPHARDSPPFTHIANTPNTPNKQDKHLSLPLVLKPSPPLAKKDLSSLSSLPSWLRSYVVSVLPSLIPGAVALRRPFHFGLSIFLLEDEGLCACTGSRVQRVPGITLSPGDAKVRGSSLLFLLLSRGVKKSAEERRGTLVFGVYVLFIGLGRLKSSSPGKLSYL
jgi:hypothetical protein